MPVVPQYQFGETNTAAWNVVTRKGKFRAKPKGLPFYYEIHKDLQQNFIADPEKTTNNVVKPMDVYNILTPGQGISARLILNYLKLVAAEAAEHTGLKVKVDHLVCGNMDTFEEWSSELQGQVAPCIRHHVDSASHVSLVFMEEQYAYPHAHASLLVVDQTRWARPVIFVLDSGRIKEQDEPTMYKDVGYFTITDSIGGGLKDKHTNLKNRR